MSLDPQDGTADYDVNPNWAAEQEPEPWEESLDKHRRMETFQGDLEPWEGSLDSMSNDYGADPILQQLEIATGVLGNIFSSIKLQYRVVDMDRDAFTGTGRTSPTYDTHELAENMQRARGGSVEVRYVTEWQETEE